MKKTFVLFALFLGVVSAWSQSKTGFTYGYEKGRTYRYLTILESTMTMDMAGQAMSNETPGRILLALKPIEINPDGGITFEAAFDSMVMRMKGMGMDTTLVLTDLIGKRAKILTNPYGRIQSITPIDSVTKGSRLMQMMDADPQMFYRRILPDLPDVPLTIGEKWMKTYPDTVKNAMMEIVVTPNLEYTLTAKETNAGVDCWRLHYTGPLTVAGKGSRMGAEFFIEGDGKANGSIFYDADKKIIVSAEGSSEQLMNIAVTGGANMTMSQSQTTHHKMSLLP